MSEDTHRQGKTIDDLNEGDSLTVNESVSDRDILLYLGMTNDNNPLYIQDEYARSMDYKAAIVPPVLLTGIITRSVSKLLPGPGSQVVNLSVNFILPVYHEEDVTFTFEVIKVDDMKEVVTLAVTGVNDDNCRIVDAVVMVRPPAKVALLGNDENESAEVSV
ncbi:MaoC/PaaZ C-terminal domain-containing protein [Liquorilactobacillus mali]|uniref:Dehydrogenase n=2 Tax=Liquorilactobacillus mali TaxID=1618 RepID=J0KXH7_9LACO|nr:MaoC/PaaZ C-terminal domain-containing protein [Liquorilactobacillus mali]EJE98260.1 Dehydrogenase with MaoC-like domain protein [Liquorilactobacillus mali KCTC 3596 = DSM 20444]KRN10494.1 dehydrogenase [Liquorilactobacillus mali KCTC 3596 = DSM 20444]KRN34230.1 dehydrogenase [Liquorilactobacillus mali]MDC7951860.1 MaoC family dehydratase N-terminal domain-containing protein [Liquorilactobacillus mali]MDN7144320.1 MaoC/PaaZ C-terminal domain-containing protein [Liquorilactobacillus mali]